MDFTLFGRTSRKAAASKGRNSRTAIAPTFSPWALSQSTVSAIVSIALPIATMTRSACGSP